MSAVSYGDFLGSKLERVSAAGFEPSAMPDHLFDFQKACVEFGIRQGRYGLYLDTGLGKTLCQLEWLRQTQEKSNGMGLMLVPLAVAKQVEREAHKFGYEARVIRDQSEAKDGTNICNYDRLDKLDVDAFGTVSLDEAGILKSFGGKTSQVLIDLFRNHKFRSVATATPAPNDHMELGQQASFLGIMSATEMLMRWFINDTAEASQKWRLKKHALNDFWDWMASWSRMAQTPSDLGFDGSRFVLPPLSIIKHAAKASHVKSSDGGLFAADVSATNIFDIKRQTTESRADLIAAIATQSNDPFVAWCDTDFESKALKDRLPSFVEVKGSMSIDEKEYNLDAFSTGEAPGIISKPSITGWGMNWQHAHRMGFCGRTFSYEAWYQAVRRCWRFGQDHEVKVHIAVAEGENQIGRVIDRKSADHDQMKAAMVAAMQRDAHKAAVLKSKYIPTHKGELPSWL